MEIVRARNDDLEYKLDEYEAEIESYKHVFREEQKDNPQLQQRMLKARETFRGTTKLARTTQAIGRLSMAY